MPTFLIIGCIYFAASLVQGFTGFGSALIAIPLLCLFIDVKFAIPLSMLCSIVITLTLSLKLQASLDLKKIYPLCLSSLPGIFIGSAFLRKVDSEIIKVLLGILLITYGIYNLISSPKQRKLHAIWGFFAGFTSGIIGSAFSAGGPPVIIYSSLNNWNKDSIKATLTGFFLFNATMIAISHGIAGITTSQIIHKFVTTIPFVVAGTLLGSYCYGKMRRTNYLTSIYILLVIMGGMIIFL